MFTVDSRLLRKAFCYGVSVVFFGSLREEINNIEKLLKKFLRAEEQLETILKS